eukprot:3978922-Alexandrium_andersonii.AAC.1
MSMPSVRTSAGNRIASFGITHFSKSSGWEGNAPKASASTTRDACLRADLRLPRLQHGGRDARARA